MVIAIDTVSSIHGSGEGRFWPPTAGISSDSLRMSSHGLLMRTCTLQQPQLNGGRRLEAPRIVHQHRVHVLRDLGRLER